MGLVSINNQYFLVFRRTCWYDLKLRTLNGLFLQRRLQLYRILLGNFSGMQDRSLFYSLQLNQKFNFRERTWAVTNISIPSLNPVAEVSETKVKWPDWIGDVTCGSDSSPRICYLEISTTCSESLQYNQPYISYCSPCGHSAIVHKALVRERDIIAVSSY